MRGPDHVLLRCDVVDLQRSWARNLQLRLQQSCAWAHSAQSSGSPNKLADKTRICFFLLRPRYFVGPMFSSGWPRLHRTTPIHDLVA